MLKEITKFDCSPLLKIFRIDLDNFDKSNFRQLKKSDKKVTEMPESKLRQSNSYKITPSRLANKNDFYFRFHFLEKTFPNLLFESFLKDKYLLAAILQQYEHFAIVYDKNMNKKSFEDFQYLFQMFWYTKSPCFEIKNYTSMEDNINNFLKVTPTF